MPEDVPLAQQPGRLTTAELTTGELTTGELTTGELTTEDRPVRESAWLSGTGLWETLYGIVFAASFVILATDHLPLGRQQVFTLSALAAMVPWYFVVGRPLICAAGPASARRGFAYVTGLFLLFAVADSQDSNAWILSIALQSQCFSVLRRRQAIWPSIAFNLMGAASVAYRNQNASGFAAAAGLAAFGITFALVYSGYVVGLIQQSERRASLISQLEATRAELAEVSRAAGVMAERQRLATEIHDTLTQGFSSILMLVQAAQAQLETSPSTARAQLDLAAQTARENLGEARTLVGGLASPLLQPGTLEDALRRVTKRAGEELGINASFDTAGASRRLPAATEVVLLRTGQEALANVRKHASAGNVAVSLCYSEGNVRLEVTDDGVGFDPVLVDGGYGLRGMRGRLDEAGGILTVRSGPAQGTSVLAEVPA
jgi:signal transduction histidine kinase